jgi:hypothetical protein
MGLVLLFGYQRYQFIYRMYCMLHFFIYCQIEGSLLLIQEVVTGSSACSQFSVGFMGLQATYSHVMLNLTLL